MWNLYDPIVRPKIICRTTEDLDRLRREPRQTAPSTAEHLFFLLENVGNVDRSADTVA